MENIVSDNNLKKFQKKGLNDLDDLLYFFPKKYHDFRKERLVKELEDKEVACVLGYVEDIEVKPKFIRVKISDRMNWKMYVYWFNNKYVSKIIKKRKSYYFCGSISVSQEYNSKTMVNPFYFTQSDSVKRIYPIYSKIQGVTNDYVQKVIESALALHKDNEYLENDILQKFNLVNQYQALKETHFPTSREGFIKARQRLVFDDLFYFNFRLSQQEHNKDTDYHITSCDKAKEFVSKLEFDLTDGQKDVLNNIIINLRKKERVNALVQGDVGSGKTILAITLMVLMWENGYQSALMCPTVVLAKQHYLELKERVEPFGIKVAFLSSDLKEKEKREIAKKIKTGEVHMVVGTHSIISKGIEFKNLSLTIVDEEHRFGVVQRNALKDKAKEGVHSVTMSATPIPRSLALTLYNNSLDIYTIKTKPKGRKPVNTTIATSVKDINKLLTEQIKNGKQCYVVCPLIEENDKLDIKSVEEVHAEFKKLYPKFKIGMISGKMKSEDINKTIDSFSENKLNILISTTIVEVGVNVPNSTVIIIYNAERFGLSQLHQLRGRVGRSSEQSYCVLLSENKDNIKLQAMCKTTDGFEIAQEDLKFRGSGDFIGTKQSGQNKYIITMLANQELNTRISEEVKLINSDPKRKDLYSFKIKED